MPKKADYLISRCGFVGGVVALVSAINHVRCRRTARHWLYDIPCPQEGRWRRMDYTCHDGVFDKAGKVVSGPPPEPLHRFQTQIDNDQLMIYVEA
jgi:Rieske Fe-S protein